MRVDTGGDIVKKRLRSRAESSEGLKTNGAKVHTVGKRLVFTKLLCLGIFSDQTSRVRRSRNVAGRFKYLI